MSQWFSIIWQARAKSNRYFDARGQTSGVISNRADAACSPELSGMARASRQPDRKATRTGCLSTGWTGGDTLSGRSQGMGDGRFPGRCIGRFPGRWAGLRAQYTAIDPQQSFCVAGRTATFLLCGGSAPQPSFCAVVFYHTKEYCGNSDTVQLGRSLDINTKPQVDSVPTFDLVRQMPAHRHKPPHAINLW